MRCAAVFDDLDGTALSSLTSPQVRTLIRAKNGALALSGAFAMFGCGRDLSAPMNISRYQAWTARSDYGLGPSDDIFGADIFGDLLFVRHNVAFRLDGETGDQVAIGDITDVLDRQLSEIAEELGGNLGRERFAHRVIGQDPLRLLPTFPFMMQQHVRGEFFETPLTRAIELKHQLFCACRDAPDGAGVDCAFWRA